MPTPPPPIGPVRLGRYSVVRRLGAGGMAEVFLARSRGAEGVDKFLVVKRILPEYAENPHFRAMFIDEARIALRLNHPNVVQVYGFESDGSTLLLIMEHVDGPDLALLNASARRLGERVPPPLVAFMVREVARGLHYAHERVDEQGRALEIVHRDVSPTNVLLSYEGAVKLGDFGIARVRSASQEVGAVQGKYSYMSPEQARGEAVDRRADIYSLGVLLAELLLGQSLFQGVASGEALLDLVRRGDLPDVERTLGEAPGALRAIVARAMRPDRAERFGSAREVGLSLTQYLHSLDAPADATALEQFIARALPPRRSTMPPPLAGTHGSAHVLTGAAPPRPGVTVAQEPVGAVTVPAVVFPGAPQPRLPRVDAAASLRERVHVAVLAGRFTASASALETRPLLALIDALAFKADATLEWRRDDSFTLVVGALRPHVDDALRAARLALDILDAARSVAADADLQGTSAPGVALGLARGVAGCARDADGQLISYELVDDAAPMAVSLASVARPGEALVAGGLYRIVRRAFVLREMSPRGPSGVRPYVLERMKSRAERDRSTDAQGWALLGREGVLQTLRGALSEVIERQLGASMLMTGELGVGKSTVLGAFASGATQLPERAGGARCVRVDANLGTQSVAYGLIAQLVRQLIAMRAEGETLTVPPEVSPYLFERTPPPVPALSPERDDLLEHAVQSWSGGVAGRRAALRALRVCLGMEADAEGAESSTTRELAIVLRPMLAEAARDRALIVLADALDMADAQSRALFADLLRRPPASAVLLLVATRGDDPLVADLSSVAQVNLAPLDLDARRRLIASALGADDATEALVKEVSAVAGGNPLTLLEVVEALGERVRLREVSSSGVSGADRERVVDLAPTRDDDLILPATLEDVLSARIEALAPEARTLLRWCALCEAELAADLVDALGGIEGPRIRGRLTADGILVTSGEDGVRLAFAHPALARVARASIDPTALPAMHARIAELLERREVPDDQRGDYAAAIARHREAAGVPRPAARAWMEAASAYASQPARGHDEVLSTYLRVLTLCAGATDGEGYLLRAAAHLGREEIARATGRVRLRRAELLALRAVAAESREARLVAEALARQARFKLEVVPGSDVGRDAHAAVRAARRAGAARVEAEARLVLALHLGQRGRFAEALVECDAAKLVLRARGVDAPPMGGTAEDGRRLAAMLGVEIGIARASMLRQVGDVKAAVRALSEAHARAIKHGQRRLFGRIYDELGMACLAQGSAVDALRFFRASIGAERELGSRERLGLTLAHAGLAYAALDRTDRALAYLQRSVDVSATTGRQGVGGGGADAHVALAEMMLVRRDLDGAAAEIERARALASRTGSLFEHFRVHLGEALLYLARRQHRLARITAEGAERTAREAGIVIEALRARALAAEAAALQGDRMAAWTYLDVVLGDPKMTDPSRVYRGDAVLSSCGRALQALGDETHAALLLRQAEGVRRALAQSFTAAVGPERTRDVRSPA